MKSSKILWGIILVYVGVIFLLENFDIIDFSWMYVWKFWPLLLLISGVNILVTRRNSKAAMILVGLITLTGLAAITYKGLQPAQDESWALTFSDNEDEESVEATTNTYTEEYDSNYKAATLTINAGASEMHINSITDKLFEADIKSSSAPYILKKTNTDSTVNLNFETQNKKRFNLKGNHNGEVNMQLSAQPVWDINLNMGAGSTDFDLSALKVKEINLKGGAANFDIKLGDLVKELHLNAETGVASVDIQVPQGVGCSIKNSSGLSAKNFEGFKEAADGTYQTENFKASQKKIYLVLKGGLSDFEVHRY